MGFAFGPNCCCNDSCYVYLWNLFHKTGASGPSQFLRDIGRLGHTGWSAPSIYPQYQGGGDAVLGIATVPSLPAAAEIVFNSIPSGSTIRWYVPGPDPTATFAEILIDDLGGHVKLVSDGVATVEEFVPGGMAGGWMSNFSVCIFKQPTCDQWVLTAIWNPNPVGPDTCPGLVGDAQGGGALIPTIITDDGSGNLNDLNSDVGGVPEIPPPSFPTCHLDNCSTVLSIPLAAKPTGNAFGLFLSGTLPIEILGLGVATPKPDGFWRSNAEAFDTGSDCEGCPQDCGCCDCTLYLTISGISKTGTSPCNASIVNGMFALASTKGINTGAAGSTGYTNICSWEAQIGHTFIGAGNAGNDCCYLVSLTMEYDRSTGYTSFVGSISAGTSTLSEGDCVGSGIGTLTPIVSYSDNTGWNSVTGGRKTCATIVGIGLTLIGGATLPGYDISSAEFLITGTDNTECVETLCETPPVTPITPPTCGDFVIMFCTDANIDPAFTGITYTVYLNGTEIGSFTPTDGDDTTSGQFYTTQSGITSSSFSANLGDYTSWCSEIPQVVISASLFVTGSNTLRITTSISGTYAENDDEYSVKIFKIQSDGTVCDIPSTSPDASGAVPIVSPTDDSYVFTV